MRLRMGGDIMGRIDSTRKNFLCRISRYVVAYAKRKATAVPMMPTIRPSFNVLPIIVILNLVLNIFIYALSEKEPLSKRLSFKIENMGMMMNMMTIIDTQMTEINSTGSLKENLSCLKYRMKPFSFSS